MKLENLKSIRRLVYRNGNRILKVTIDESTYHINMHLLTLPEISIHKDINEIIRNVGFNNLFWLSGCNCDFETWKHKIKEWDNDFFKNEIEKERALKSFYNVRLKK
jgi:hypothetical protein